ncbi:MAG: transposase [Gammaproteobacteria bacterium]|nr:transposase [Gammaproteobacteria bacterium]
MPRMARLVVPDYPHHITQRGSRKQQTFFGDDDYLEYLRLLHENQLKADVDIWAYCLMPNHVHLVAVPKNPDGLSKLLQVTHHRYARRVNSRYGWRGHLWQERFHSFVMDERHLLAAVRYVELNPVRADLCARADQWRWSSVHANLHGRADPIVNPAPMSALVSDWAAYLSEPESGPSIQDIRRHTATGRPAGDKSFVSELETLLNRQIRKMKPGPTPRN